MLPLVLSSPSFSTTSPILAWMIFSLSVCTTRNPSRTLRTRSFGIQSAMRRTGSARIRRPIHCCRSIWPAVGRLAPARGENMVEKARPSELPLCEIASNE